MYICTYEDKNEAINTVYVYEYMFVYTMYRESGFVGIASVLSN